MNEKYIYYLKRKNYKDFLYVIKDNNIIKVCLYTMLKQQKYKSYECKIQKLSF